MMDDNGTMNGGREKKSSLAEDHVESGGVHSSAQTPDEEGIARLVSRLSEWREEWQREFSQATEGERQDYLLQALANRLYWRIMHYMRKYPQRLVSSQHTYSDRCVGGDELTAIVTQGKNLEDSNTYCLQWLEEHQIPDMDRIGQHLLIGLSQVDALLSIEGNDCAAIRFVRQFGLTPVEFEIVSTLALIMLNEDILKLMTVAWADFSVRLPTVSFLSQLLGNTPEEEAEVVAAFEENGILRRMRLILLGNRSDYPYGTPRRYAPVTIEQTVVDAFQGRIARELPVHMSLVNEALPLKRILAEASLVEELTYALSQSRSSVCLIGTPHSGRRTLCASIVHAKFGKRVLEVDMCRVLDTTPNEGIEVLLATMMREALLANAVLMLRLDGIEEKENASMRFGVSSNQIAKIVASYPGCVVLLAQKYTPILGDAFRKPIVLTVPRPSVEQAKKVWQKALAGCEKAEREKMSEVFSRNYSLPIGSIFSVVRDAADGLQSMSESGQTSEEACNTGISAIRSHHVLNEIRKSFRHQLGELAEITVSDVPLSGVVLTPDAKLQVDEILEYAKNLHLVLDTWGFRQRSPYGNALSVLFAGAPGTGKTLLACALANELGKVLYRVDLSRIVDKYIGETEKNLARIFDEAAKAQAIILFDEADSLFAKRTEVKSSNDRYANLEINFLLQKLESYNGITILTTNLSKSIDEAFRRRIRFIVDFPMPDVKARAELWKRMLPPNAPVSEDIRWAWLAKTFEMSGGYIRNAVLKASINAAGQGVPIGMEHLVKAAEAEARSMGQLLRIQDDEDFEVYDEDE